MSENSERDPHAEALLTLAGAMARYALWPSAVAGVACVLLFWVLQGLPGLVGSAIGATLALVSSALTLFLMRKSAPAGPHMGMAALFGGLLLKCTLFLLVLVGLQRVDFLHRESLGITMAVLVVIAAGAEALAFKRTKLPTVIPAADQ